MPGKTKTMRRTKKQLSDRGRKIISISAFVVFILFSVAACWFIGKPMIETIANPEHFRLWVDAHGFLGRLAYVGMVVIQVVIAFIPGEVIEIGGGYAFGFWEGTLWCMTGLLIGSTLVFLLVRRFGVKLVEAFFPIEKIHAIKFVKDTRRLNLLVFIAFFIPGTPKDLLAYLVGLTPMKLSTWLLITMTARIPSVVTSTYGGSALGNQEYFFAVCVFVLTLILAAVGIWVYKKWIIK